VCSGYPRIVFEKRMISEAEWIGGGEGGGSALRPPSPADSPRRTRSIRRRFRRHQEAAGWSDPDRRPAHPTGVSRPRTAFATRLPLAAEVRTPWPWLTTARARRGPRPARDRAGRPSARHRPTWTELCAGCRRGWALRGSRPHRRSRARRPVHGCLLHVQMAPRGRFTK